LDEEGMVVVCILSRLDETESGIFLHTESEVEQNNDSQKIEAITNYFLSNNCPAMIGRPKVFLFLDCGGLRKDFAVPATFVSSLSPLLFKFSIALQN
jgi:hypothetical protein